MPNDAPVMSRTVLVVFGALAVGALAWRGASRRRRLPCPAWLGWILENPYTDAVAGSATLLRRAGVEPGMHVLDVGSGPGRLTIPAAVRVGPAGGVVALDVQEAMLAQVRQKAAARGLANVRTVLGAVETRALDLGAFDRVLLVAVLGEVPNRERALRALYASLRPDGVLSVTEMMPDPHYQSRQRVRRLATAAGFRLDQTFGAPLAFTMNFRKPA